MANLYQLKQQLLADGIIDATEVQTIKDVIYEDGKVDKEEAEFLFELNDAVSGKDNAPEWKSLFVDAITSYVLEDLLTPNEIDEYEAMYLYEHIKSDGQVDEIELALLENLKSKSKNFPDILASLLQCRY